MASSNTPVSLATRKALRILEILVKVFVAAFVAQFLLSAFGTPGVDQLSGGEKQRVAIARALANTPALILADEPTANLDSHHGAETMRLLRRLAKSEGATVLIVSHDQRLREIADRVLWLEDGRLKTLAALARDPVCGMLLDPAQAPARLETAEGTLVFCAAGCRDEYLAINTQ